jgi:hypothetical protein
MKTKKTAPPRRRISFAVDRDEIEINSDWVQAVMSRPSELPPSPAPPEIAPAIPPVTESTAGIAAPPINNATGEVSSTGEECTPVEITAAVENEAPVVKNAAVADYSTVSEVATVAMSATVELDTTDSCPDLPDLEENRPSTSTKHDATVAISATDELSATEPSPSATEDHPELLDRVHEAPLLRRPRPRLIQRVTDGLTPGQYAAYSLMYEAGETAGAPEEVRIYRGGYADLCRLTGLSKRGIQNIVAELQEKNVIEIHQAPGYHRTETSAYRVKSPASVVRHWHARGLRFALGKSKTLVTSAPAAP